jgi:beta-lactamase regulating signal transducer with metallopeptidase domain
VRPATHRNASHDRAAISENERDVVAAANHLDAWRVFWGAFWNTLQEPPAENVRSRWPVVLSGLLLAGIGLAGARLLAGLAAVRAYRTKTRRVQDGALLDLLAIVRAELGCRTEIELRESPRIASPATVGWRHPLILLPLGWRGWSDEERRAILAHEVAHVERGDYLVWLVAQISLALHFYHPLVYWLAGRLRAEQEMAADSRGALVLGGRRAYLQTLARIALREDSGRMSWALRPFLPTSKTFIRRIEMLRNSTERPYKPITFSGRLLVATLLAGLALLIAGVRGPESGLATVAIGAEESKQATSEETNLALVPDAPLALVELRPAEILSRPGAAPLVKMLKEHKFDEQLGLSFDELSSVVAVMSAPPSPSNREPFQRVILRSKNAHDFAQFVRKVLPNAVDVAFAGRTYSKSAQAAERGGPAYLVLDDRTLVYAATETELREMIIDSTQPRSPSWRDQWKQAARGELNVMVDMRQVHKLVDHETANAVPGTPQGALLASLAAVSPLWEQSDRLMVSTDLDSGLGLSATIVCSSADAAERVKRTVDALLTLASNGIEKARQQMPNRPPQEAALISMVLTVGESLIRSAQVAREGSVVRVTSSASDVAGVSAVAAVLLPAAAQAREAARRAQSINNMKQIGLAMHMYYDAHKRLPPAVLLGPDGKTPHSWRVALLPYLDQQQLYQEYHLDEPWDSVNNRKVLAKMPAVYRHPSDSTKSSDAAYFVLTGPDTLFSGAEGKTFVEVTDGTSHTILSVEAKRDIPWTKPEDIPYDADQPLPALGGWLDGEAFEVGMADGSVRMVSNKIDEKMWRALVTPSGGESPVGF